MPAIAFFIIFSVSLTIGALALAATKVASQKSEPNIPDESVLAESNSTQIEKLLQHFSTLNPLPGRDSVPTIVIESKGDDSGEADKTILTIDQQGRFLRQSEFSCGSEATLSGFDGSDCWHQDQIGLTKSLSYSDRELVLILSRLRAGLIFTTLDPSTLSVDSRSNDTEAVIAITRHGVSSYLTISLNHGLPTKLEFASVQGEMLWEFADYQEMLGWKIPMTIMTIDPLSTTTVQVSKVCAVSDPERMNFTSPPSRLPRIEFDPSKTPGLRLRRSKTGHVLVGVSIDENDPVTFIFDTGAGGTVVDREYARQVGLKQVGNQKAVTIYTSEITTVVRGATLAIGPARLKQPRMVTMDLSSWQELMGAPIKGVIGYDLLSQCVCEIELGIDEILVHDAARFERDLEWQPIVFYQNIPLLTGKFPLGEGLFRIDVGAANGAAGNVIFHAPLFHRLKMAKPEELKAIEGTTEYARGSVDWFELGSHRFDSPEVIFALGKSGPLADPYIAGNLGVEFLKPFRIVLDYRNARMAICSPLGFFSPCQLDVRLPL